MSLVGPALWFLAHYLLTLLVCGGVVWRLVSPRWTDIPQSSDERRRFTVSAFLIGTALAPFLIGLVQGVLWFTVRNQPLWLSAALQWLWVVVALVLARRWVRSCWIELVDAIGATPTRRLGAIVLLLVLVFISAHAAFHSLSPQRNYDASTYALDARRLAEGRSWSALMGHEPQDKTNQFANHNHGSSYQSFLSASLLYGDPRQDFALRVAQRVLAVHVFIVLIGLGVRLGWAIGLLAPLLLLTYVFFGSLIGSASRDFYRILPLLFIVGLFRMGHAGGAWPGFNAQGLLIALGFTFLWNSHASSLLIAPMLLACMLVLAPRASAIAALIAGFAIAVPLGAGRLVRSYLETGDPLHDSPFYNHNYLGTAIIEPWFAARGTLPAGISHAFEKLALQFNADGPIAAIILWSSIVATLTWCAVKIIRRRAPGSPLAQSGDSGGPMDNPMLLLAGGFVLISVLLLAGAFDVVTGKLSVTLAMNPRYRAHWYPLAALVAAFFIWHLLFPLARRLPSWTMQAAILALAAGALVHAATSWEGHQMGLFTDTRKAHAHLAENVPYFRWAGMFRCLDQRELVLMDIAYLGWYQTDNVIMFTQDPRLRPAFVADDPAEVVRYLDSLGVRYVLLIDLERTAILNSGVALAQALQSTAFELVIQTQESRYLYRRAAERSEPAGPPAPSAPPAPPASAGPASPPSLMLTRCRSLMTELQSQSLAEREAAVEAMIRLGSSALPAISRLQADVNDDHTRRTLDAIVRTIASERPTAIQLVDALQIWPRLKCTRPDARPLDRWTGPQFAAHLRNLALMRGVSVANTAEEFLRQLSARSLAGQERFILRDEARVEHDLLDWFESAGPTGAAKPGTPGALGPGAGVGAPSP